MSDSPYWLKEPTGFCNKEEKFIFLTATMMELKPLARVTKVLVLAAEKSMCATLSSITLFFIVVQVGFPSFRP